MNTERLREPRIPSEVIVRTHAPPAGAYATYRSCLRWEFAFHCAFCWLHEWDIAVTSSGAERTGMFWVEHHELRSQRPDLVDVYSNCLWSCRFCNGARAGRAPESDGRRLLVPTEVAWCEHFRLDCGHLRPAAGDVDAQYTHEAYDLDDPRKVALRRERSERLLTIDRALEELPPLLERLLDRAAGGDLDCLAAAREVQAAMQRASSDAQRMASIPLDAPAQCRCERGAGMPSWSFAP